MTKSFDTNVKGLLFTVQKSLPLLQDGGSIILTAATGSIKAKPGIQCVLRDEGCDTLVCARLENENGGQSSLLILMPQDFAE
jgi:NAD(P)-dependent dehydrogenase (short-subunit alcohol dehydrogenase family)